MGQWLWWDDHYFVVLNIREKEGFDELCQEAVTGFQKDHGDDVLIGWGGVRWVWDLVRGKR